MTIADLKLSYHCSHDRVKRLSAIQQYVGLGEIAYTFPDHRKGTDYEALLTTTGVFMVKTKDTEEIVTIYVANFKKTKALFYKNNSRIPKEIKEVIERNHNLSQEIKTQLDLY